MNHRFAITYARTTITYTYAFFSVFLFVGIIVVSSQLLIMGDVVRASLEVVSSR